jgi:hypothetical protein
MIPYRVIVIPDLQVPYEDKRSLAAVEKYMADETWDEYINLGDFLDFDNISVHNKGKIGLNEGKTIDGFYKAGNVILDRHQKILRANNKKAKFTLLEGNHDYRIEKYIEEHPESKGLLEVEKGLCLKERGIKFVRCYSKGELYKLGKSYWHHGLYCGGNHAKKMVDNFGVNVFYGHTHDVSLHSKVQWGKDKTIVGQSLGCLCDYEQSYIKMNPTNWQHAFGVFYYLPSGYFTYYVVRIFNHSFVAPNGKIYSA